MNTWHIACLLSCVFALTAADAVAQRAAPTGDHGLLGNMTLIECGQGSLEYLPGDYYLRAGYEGFRQGKPDKAVSMFESAAGWGDKRAMFNLGLILVRGNGVAKDEPLGLAWLALSAERGKDRLQRETLASAWQLATPEVRAHATQLWNRMKLEYADKVALIRAQDHYRRRTSGLRNAFGSDPVRIDGLCGPKTVAEALQALDDIAADAILRPGNTPDGEVIIGTPQKTGTLPATSPTR